MQVILYCDGTWYHPHFQGDWVRSLRVFQKGYCQFGVVMVFWRHRCLATNCSSNALCLWRSGTFFRHWDMLAFLQLSKAFMLVIPRWWFDLSIENRKQHAYCIRSIHGHEAWQDKFVAGLLFLNRMALSTAHAASTVWEIASHTIILN